MNITSTWHYETLDQARNAEDHLRSSGIPTENIFVDEAGDSMMIIIAEAAQPEVLEILGQHGLTKIH